MIIISKTDFKFNISDIIKDKKRNFTIIKQIRIKDKNGYNIKWYLYHCNKCNYDGKISEKNLLKGTGCACCTNKIAVLGKNTIWDTNRWMCDLGVSIKDAKKYTYGSQHKVYPKCPICGQVRDRPIALNVIYKHKSIFCNCSDGLRYPNKFSYAFLNQLNNIYNLKYLTHEYSPEWIKPKKYDNYFEYNNKKYILEMDGGWHYLNNTLSGKTAEEAKNIDKYKDRLAKEHNIKVIRIDCRKSELGWIKNNILNSDLSVLFNLANINWIQCSEFATKNLIKTVCNFKNKNIDFTTKQIGEEFHLNRNTITRYLKLGNCFGWCDYDTEIQKLKNIKNIIKINSKKVEILYNNKLLGKFDSIKQLSEKSKSLFGIYLNRHSLSDHCCGKTLGLYKGYEIKFC